MPERERNPNVYSLLTYYEPSLEVLYRMLEKPAELPEPVPIDKLGLPARTVTGLTRAGYRSSDEMFDDFDALTKKGQIGKVVMARIRVSLKQLGYPID